MVSIFSVHPKEQGLCRIHRGSSRGADTIFHQDRREDDRLVG